MRLVKGGHAGVRLESDHGVLVIDPGGFTDPSVLDGAEAVLVTHEHVDHVKVDELVARPHLRVYTHAAVAKDLAAIGDSVTTIAAGDRFTAAGFEVEAVGGTHAVIHPDIPVIANVGFIVDGLVYHPGDWQLCPLVENRSTIDNCDARARRRGRRRTGRRA